MKKTLSIFFGAILVLAILALLFLNYATYSEGTRAGQVIKVSKKGVVFKTWEGQLNMQSFGAVKSDNSLAEVFTFSVQRGDTVVFSKLQEVALTGERVNLHYEQKYTALPWKGDSKFFIVRVEQLPENRNRSENEDRDPYREER